MKIKVYGLGCARHLETKRNVKKAISKLCLNAYVKKITTENDDLGIPLPAIVFNQQVLCSGRVPSVQEIKKMIKPSMPIVAQSFCYY